MSAIAAAFRSDGLPFDERLIKGILASLNSRGPHGNSHWVGGGVLLAHSRLDVTAESVKEEQPLKSSDGTVALVFDGRVDNREELKDELVSAGLPPRDPSDAELVLRSYECWGERSPRKIVGDFAYVVWDSRRRQLFCVRDPLGIKPLYYCMIGTSFICGSELRQAALHPALSFRPNEDMVAEFLTGGFSDSEETLYRDVKRLPPGHILALGYSGLACRRYYDWERPRELRYASDDDYTSQFFELFKEAVRCRLRNPGSGIASQLSGGLDSSSVTSMAAFLYQSNPNQFHSLETFSLIAPNPRDGERRYITDVVARWKLSSTLLSPAPFKVDYCLEQVRHFRDIPNYPNDVACSSLHRAIQEKGTRVVLTGLGGDNWFFGRHEYYAGLVRRLSIRSLVNRFLDDAKLKQLNPYSSGPWEKLVRFGLIPSTPLFIRILGKGLLGRSNYPSWISHAFAKRTHLPERLIASRKLNAASATDIPNGKSFFLFELVDRMASSYQFEMRHPLSDLRLIQFSRSLPDDQRRRGIWQRYIMRQAMRDLLPESIYSRSSKAAFNWTFAAAQTEINLAKLLRSSTIAELGWIDADQALRTLNTTSGGSSQSVKLFAIAAVEWWYKENFEKQDSVRSSNLSAGSF